jgi:UDPglucose 6-dehydrogenase
MKTKRFVVIRMTKISILGSGMVGSAVGQGFLKLGNQVIFYDVDEQRVKTLRSHDLVSTSKIERAIDESEISFICVPTPVTENGMDLSYIESVVKDLALCLKSKTGYHVVVLKSTILPGTTENTVIPLLEHISHKTVGDHIGVSVNPEFLTEIDHSWADGKEFSRDFFSEDKIVVGEFDRKSGDAVEGLYDSLKIPVVRTDLKTAETIKFACNCALASRISYWNEIFYICQRLGVDSNLVAQTAAMDKRIGKYGTVHGKAFGGKCLPKDLKALIKFSERTGYEPRLLRAVLEVNDRIKADRGVRE